MSGFFVLWKPYALDFQEQEGLISVPVSGKLMVDSGEALLMAAHTGMGILLQAAELVHDELAAGKAFINVLLTTPVPARQFISPIR